MNHEAIPGLNPGKTTKEKFLFVPFPGFNPGMPLW